MTDDPYWVWWGKRNQKTGTNEEAYNKLGHENILIPGMHGHSGPAMPAIPGKVSYQSCFNRNNSCDHYFSSYTI